MGPSGPHCLILSGICFGCGDLCKGKSDTQVPEGPKWSFCRETGSTQHTPQRGGSRSDRWPAKAGQPGRTSGRGSPKRADGRHFNKRAFVVGGEEWTSPFRGRRLLPDTRVVVTSRRETVPPVAGRLSEPTVFDVQARVRQLALRVRAEGVKRTAGLRQPAVPGPKQRRKRRPKRDFEIAEA